jgi:hypothetical protein
VKLKKIYLESFFKDADQLALLGSAVVRIILIL